MTTKSLAITYAEDLIAGKASKNNDTAVHFSFAFICRSYIFYEPIIVHGIRFRGRASHAAITYSCPASTRRIARVARQHRCILCEVPRLPNRPKEATSFSIYPNPWELILQLLASGTYSFMYI